MENYSVEIPFGKAVRVNNFKLWRSKYTIGQGSDKMTIDSVNISNLDGSWMTRIPSTSQMYSVIINSYNTNDEQLRGSFLGMLFGNIYNLALTPSEALHDAFFFLNEMMTFPYLLLSEKEMKKRMEENLKVNGMDKSSRKEYIAKMVDYRKQLYELIDRKRDRFIEEYERQMAEHRVSEPEDLKALEHDELAEQAMDIATR